MQKLYLRSATISDCKKLLVWHNDPVALSSAFNSQPVSLRDHKEWFLNALADSDVKIFILTDGTADFGQVRVNRENQKGTIDYSIASELRKKGFGRLIIQLLEEKIEEIHFVSKLVAEVKKENIASQKVFESLCYKKVESEDFFLYEKTFELKLVNVIVSNKPWHKKFVSEIETKTNSKILYIDDKSKVTKAFLSELNPRYVFFPHWSYIIPSEVYENFECVIFHMTDLPFGRGGSPLQNLIERGIYETKLTALRCRKELDAGPIYKKLPLSLWGTAEEIYNRAGEISKEMMIDIINKQPTPQEQTGEPVVFKRRRPEQGNIASLDSLEKVFDYIRMLDAETYPPAFIETEHLRFEFSRASLRTDHLLADVKISLRENSYE